MTVIALSTNETLWWITLGVGLVVALLVWLLLELLRRRVAEVDRGVTEIWSMGKRLAQNTQATHLLDTTSTRGQQLQAALERQQGGNEEEAPWRPS